MTGMEVVALVDQSRSLHRWIVLVVVGLVPLVRMTSASDAFSLPKAALMFVAAASLIGASVGGLVDRLRSTGRSARSVFRRPANFTILTCLFLAMMFVSALAADSTVASLLGPYRRWNGWVLQAAAAGIGLAVAVDFRRNDLSLLGWVVAATGLVASIHAILQWAGAVDTNMVATGSPALASLGNANFLAGYLAVAIPLAARAAVAPAVAWHRPAAAIAAAVMLWAMLLTRSLQGPAALAAAGLAFLIVKVWHRNPGMLRASLAVAAAGGVAAISGLMGAGPFGWLAAERSFVLRGHYWDAAVRMALEHPLFGVGPGRYIGWFRSVRSPEAAQLLPPTLDVDGAHSVPLDVFASGGIVAGALYLTVIALALAALVRVVRSTDSTDRTLVAGFAAAWAAYATQASVSLDTPALLLVGWVLTGALVALGRGDRRSGLQASGRPRPRRRGGKRSQAARRAVTPAWVTGGAVVATLPALVVAGALIRADVGLNRAIATARSGQVAVAVRQVEDATAGIGIVSRHQLLRAEILAAGGREEAATQAYRRAVDLDGRSLQALISLARHLERIGDPAAAAEVWARVREVEPHVDEFPE